MRQRHKMVKHTQTIRRLLPMNCLSVFNHFLVLVLKNNLIVTLLAIGPWLTKFLGYFPSSISLWFGMLIKVIVFSKDILMHKKVRFTKKTFVI